MRGVGRGTEMGGRQHLGLSTPAVPQNWAGQSPQPEAVPGGGGPPRPGGPVAFTPRPARARHLQCLFQGRKPALGRSLPHSPSEKCSPKTKICHSCLGQGFLQPSSGCGGFTLISDRQFDQRTLEHVCILLRGRGEGK